MALKVIGVGLGRTGTLSLKLALEYLGFGPCDHMTELYAAGREKIPLWIDAIRGKPDWEKIFDGFCSVTDYPANYFYKEFLHYYDHAKFILTVRDADSWFDSVNETIFASRSKSGSQVMFGDLGRELSSFIRKPYGEHINDKIFMQDKFLAWNHEVIESIPKEKLLVLSVGEGWGPLCEFLGQDVPNIAYPRVHGRNMKSKHSYSSPPKDEATFEYRMQRYLSSLRSEIGLE